MWPIQFLNEIEKLKTIKRYNRTLDGRQENTAEHSWNAAMMAMVLAPYAPEGTSIDRVIKMLIVHDLAEVYHGDVCVYDEDYASKSAEEVYSLDALLTHLSAPMRDMIKALWLEFDERQSPDALFAAAIDGLQPLSNHMITADPAQGQIAVEKVLQKKRFIQSACPKLWPLAAHLIAESQKKGLYI